MNILVGVLDTVIQVTDGVEGHIGKVLLVDVVGETGAELDSELALHVCQLLKTSLTRTFVNFEFIHVCMDVKVKRGCARTNHRVGVRGGDGDSHPPEQSDHELLGLTTDEGTDDSSVEGSNVDGEHSSEDYCCWCSCSCCCLSATIEKKDRGDRLY